LEPFEPFSFYGFRVFAADTAGGTMYAVVEIAGEQVKVEEGNTVRVNRLQGDVGEKVTLDRVLLLGGQGDPKIGTPVVDGAAVEASILSHGKGKKVIVFKMKRRKDYRRRNGHRQPFTEIMIEKIAS
jgi:large subunit ribosomal protein L21